MEEKRKAKPVSDSSLLEGFSLGTLFRWVDLCHLWGRFKVTALIYEKKNLSDWLSASLRCRSQWLRPERLGRPRGRFTQSSERRGVLAAQLMDLGRDGEFAVRRRDWLTDCWWWCSGLQRLVTCVNRCRCTRWKRHGAGVLFVDVGGSGNGSERRRRGTVGISDAVSALSWVTCGQGSRLTVSHSVSQCTAGAPHDCHHSFYVLFFIFTASLILHLKTVCSMVFPFICLRVGLQGVFAEWCILSPDAEQLCRKLHCSWSHCAGLCRCSPQTDNSVSSVSNSAIVRTLASLPTAIGDLWRTAEKKSHIRSRKRRRARWSCGRSFSPLLVVILLGGGHRSGPWLLLRLCLPNPLNSADPFGTDVRPLAEFLPCLSACQPLPLPLLASQTFLSVGCGEKKQKQRVGLCCRAQRTCTRWVETQLVAPTRRLELAARRHGGQLGAAVICIFCPRRHALAGSVRRERTWTARRGRMLQNAHGSAAAALGQTYDRVERICFDVAPVWRPRLLQQEMFARQTVCTTSSGMRHETKERILESFCAASWHCMK